MLNPLQERIYNMHSLPAIVIMNMTKEQREVYHKNESKRLKEKALAIKRAAAERRKFWTCIGVVLSIVAVAIVMV
jgi:hypothetical protein